VIRLDPDHTPLRLYQLRNTLPASKLRGLYGCRPPKRPSRAPPWLVRDYSNNLSRAW
jgi:hypothetical protein